MSLIEGDQAKRDKIINKIEKFGPFVSLVAYVAGLVYFCLLPHDSIVHRTYISENALLPGLVSSDIYTPDSLIKYHDLIKSHYESQKSGEIDINYIKELFSKQIQIETYIQHFNVSDPFVSRNYKNQYFKEEKNLYAFVRAHRTDGTESIVVSASLYIIENNEQVPNLGGIAQLLMLADLARTRPYWAKDLIFLISETGYIGAQTWINSYFGIKTPFVEAENLIKRGGSIQAALNIELSDLNVDRLELKLEGANGKVPNLDLFNSIIRICKAIQFKCWLQSEKSPIDYSQYSFDRDPINYQAGLHNTISMLFRQATGIPISLHGSFLEYRIEALTITGGKPTRQNQNKKNFKQNILKISRIIEGTLRSINNLLERFHQSFFFYLLASSNHYISIGNYMPPLGLVILPMVIQIIRIWCSIFFRKRENNNENSVTLLLNLAWFIFPKILISLGFGLALHFGTPYFVAYGSVFNLGPRDSLLNCYIAIVINIIAAPILINFNFTSRNGSGKQMLNETSDQLLILFTLLALTLFLGALSLFNFSLAFLTSILYVPVSLIAIKKVNSKFSKGFQLILLLIALPIIYYSILYGLYLAHYERFNVLNNYSQFFDRLNSKFYDLALMSKLNNVWTFDLLNLILIPIWSLLWSICFPRF